MTNDAPSVSAEVPDKAVCLFCRQRKVKCDRAKPACGNCVKNGFECNFITEADRKKPGLRAGYVSQLEKRLASVEDEIDQLKTNKRPRPDVNGQSPSSLLDSQQPNSHHIHRTIFQDLYQSPDYLQDREALTQLCREWFAKYHPWFPILHQITLLEELNVPCLYCSPHVLVFRAIAAVTATEQRKRSDAMRDSIFLAVSKTLSLRSLQALLILTILDYGDGKIPQFYNLIAVCKRMSIQLGLRDLVAIQGGNFNKPSGSIPPRMLRLPQNLVHREECIRAYWITEALDSASTIGTAWNLLLNPRVKSEWVPCRDDIWTAPERIDVESLQDEDSFSATFTLYVGLVCDVCHDVHSFLQTPFRSQNEWQERAEEVYQRLMAWRNSHWRSNFLASPGGNRKTPFVAISLVIACTFHLAKLSLFQRPVFTNLDAEHTTEPWLAAINRCFDSCNSIATDICTASVEELEHIHPQVSFCIYVTARFLLLCIKDPRSNHFVDLMKFQGCMDAYQHALRIGGRRWPFARRLENVITTAIEELNSLTAMSPLGMLPAQFWDPQYLSLDVDEALRCWAEQVKHPFQ